MAELKDRLRADLNDAMRSRDQVRMRTLRMALTSITNEEVSGASARDLTDDEIVRVLTREAKKRREAADAFSVAGRTDQAAAERAEGDVLAGYLPAQLSDDELTTLVSAAIAETGAAGPGGIGPVMKAVTPRVAGRADGARVAAEVRRQLSSQLPATQPVTRDARRWCWCAGSRPRWASQRVR
ncbi:MAG: GatB/YqeY domain-containing protein [Streptosporangiaceae bacterium]|nr:GatB/YqeY domain-containing protein [Streptosporangiaceae bacterium]